MPGCRANHSVRALQVVVLVLMASSLAHAQERDPFQKGTVGVEIGFAPMAEIWNLNDRREEVIEGTASFWGSVTDRVALGIEFHHAFVLQHTPGAFVQGLSPLVRWKVTRRPLWNWYVETGPGVSWSDLRTPPRGTKFNYLFQAGTGVMRRVGRSSHVMVAYRFLHLSNHGREGSDHNPDLEMMGVYAGWSFSF
jgi:hypothetical protein